MQTTSVASTMVGTIKKRIKNVMQSSTSGTLMFDKKCKVGIDDNYNTNMSNALTS